MKNIFDSILQVNILVLTSKCTIVSTYEVHCDLFKLVSNTKSVNTKRGNTKRVHVKERLCSLKFKRTYAF